MKRVLGALVRVVGPGFVAVALGLATVSPTRSPGPRVIGVGGHVANALDPVGISAGPVDAPVVVRVLGDYECSACEELDRIAGRTLRLWAREGRVRFQLVQAPLSAHRRAPRATAALYCAHAQGGAWPMHDLIMANRGEWGWGADPTAAFVGYARALDLDSAAFSTCLDDAQTEVRSRMDRMAAKALGVSSVPVILVGAAIVRPSRSFTELLEYVESRIEAES